MSASNLIEFFTHDHRTCDESWLAVETAADNADSAATSAAFTQFKTEMLRHFNMEESVLFPAFEDATGMTQGPTTVMRMEHEQMRGLLSQMADAAAGGDFENLTDLGDTLLMVIGQHNAKEEGMLYPMAQEHIPVEWNELKSRIDAV